MAERARKSDGAAQRIVEGEGRFDFTCADGAFAAQVRCAPDHVAIGVLLPDGSRALTFYTVAETEEFIACVRSIQAKVAGGGRA